MTDEDKRQQKAMLLLEYQEAEQHLAALQEKARRTVDSLKMVAEWLEKTYDRTWNFEITSQLYSRNQTPPATIDDSRFKGAMDYGQMLELARQIKAAMDNLRSLSQRKEALGLK